jgi:hypothetical protein
MNNLMPFYWTIAAALSGLLLFVFLKVRKEEMNRIKKIKSLAPGSRLWIIHAGQPTNVLLVHHNKDYVTVRWHGLIMDVSFEQVITPVSDENNL